ncbi:MAG: glycosyltransferase family 4 protein [Actinomycetota bacterium]|nr:glycosyltransferase family 4 protein [Actinomycetota bacterium]
MRLHQSQDPPLHVSGLRVVQVVATTTGGTGAHVALLTEQLTRAGAEVTVCGPVQAQEQFGFAALGATFQRIRIGSAPHPRDTLTVRLLRRAAKDADVVHAHGLRAGALTGLATSRSTPFVITRHNLVLATSRIRRLREALERYTARRADVTMCVSSDLVDAVRAAGGEDVRRTFVTAPPMKPAGRTRAEVREELAAADRPVVLAVGRLHPQKDWPTLVAAALELSALDPTPVVVIAGDGPQRAELEKLVASSQAPIRLLGERTDIPDLLAAADVLVLTSVWEAGSLAVQEGLRAGVPFVGTRVGAIPDLVADAGLLVPVHDAHAVATQVRRVLTEPGVAEDLRDRAHRRARVLPTDADVAGQVVAAYSGALAAVRGRA